MNTERESSWPRFRFSTDLRNWSLPLEKKKFIQIAAVLVLVGLCGCNSGDGDTDFGGLAKPLPSDPKALSLSNQYPFANTDVLSSSNYVTIRGGTFIMGSPEKEVNRFSDETQHRVSIASNFEMQITNVTQAQYFLVMRKNKTYYAAESVCPEDFQVIDGIKICPNHPVEWMSMNDAKEFIAKLNEQDAKYSYRLPTEAEWEYAARAGTSTAFWFGNDEEKAAKSVWMNANSNGIPHAVGTKPANPWGLYEIVGNVSQWVSDFYASYPLDPQTSPTGPATGSKQIFRGGGFNDSSMMLRSAARNAYASQDLPLMGTGLRLVRSLRQN